VPAKRAGATLNQTIIHVMPKGLRLKRTPAEQAERDLRKARRAAKKATSKQYLPQDAGVDSEDPFLDPGPSTSRHGARTVPSTEDSFHEKLWDAFGDDDRLENVEARLNEYAHIPRRWRGVSPQDYATDGGLDADDPALMNDDEYAEWVRMGMWRCDSSHITRYSSFASSKPPFPFWQKAQCCGAS
jgi:hypothetical protein